MSHEAPHASDRAAAYRGLILGAIVLGALLYTVSRVTHAYYSSKTAPAAAAVRPVQGHVVALDA
jgi:hypothetical protein